MRHAIINVFLFVLVAPATATELVVATGDSQTAGYAPVRFNEALTANGIGAVAQAVASGGATATIYSGLAPDIHDGGAYHDFAADAINAGARVVTFMLGTNDALQATDGFATYANLISHEFDQLDAAHVKVVVGTPLPILWNPNNTLYSLADNRIRDEFIPWLQQQAQQRGYVFLDLYSAIQQQPNWQSWYSDDGVSPGYVHLWGGLAQTGDSVGYHWLANEFALGVQQALVPEPSSLLLMLAGALALGLRVGSE